ncbi:hypothetical protein Tco_1217110 [Tanacetum coccineum]
MVTYLKHMGKYTHNQLKIKSLEKIQKLYEREQKLINDFVPMDSEVVGSSAEKGVGSRKKTLARKRTGGKDSEERRYDIRWYQSHGALDLGSTREMITSQLQGKLWLYDEVRTRLCLFCHHQIGEDCWELLI